MILKCVLAHFEFFSGGQEIGPPSCWTKVSMKIFLVKIFLASSSNLALVNLLLKYSWKQKEKFTTMPKPKGGGLLDARSGVELDWKDQLIFYTWYSMSVLSMSVYSLSWDLQLKTWSLAVFPLPWAMFRKDADNFAPHACTTLSHITIFLHSGKELISGGRTGGDGGQMGRSFPTKKCRQE